MENTSGQGKQASVPPEIDRWNWGAFFLNWIWGLAHNTPIALLCFVPCVNIFMPFVLGLRGSAWAWQNRRWDSVEQFRRSQRNWGLAGFALLLCSLLFAAGAFAAVTYGLKQSDVYKLAYSQLSSDPTATRILGAPIETGMVQGSINTTGPSGSADISFSVRGPKAKGTLYTQAQKDAGRWHIERMELEVDGSPRRIPLVEPAPLTPGAPGVPLAPGKPTDI
ncbi:MAG: cytochrome c oxidase assembly factor Coa1 family protein [Myxococcota bacterium]